MARGRWGRPVVAAAGALALVVGALGACSDDGGSGALGGAADVEGASADERAETESTTTTEAEDPDPTVPGTEPVGDPVGGGSLVYGVESVPFGLCLPEMQLDAAGATVARAIYDTLTAPNADGEVVPYLAESVTPNDDLTEWVITLRDGVTFHDGSSLTAEVVKNNLDAYRGAPGQHARNPLVFLFVLEPIEAVEVTGDLEVTVTTSVPWAAFPAALHSGGRMGMLGQAQLDDTIGCDEAPIGTGAFRLTAPTDFQPANDLRLVASPDHWQIAPDGEPYPYLDELEFTTIVEDEQRVNALEAGDVDLIQTSDGFSVDRVRTLVEDGLAVAAESAEATDVSFVLLNTSVPPLDDVRVRQAMALAIDREDVVDVVGVGVPLPASGLFPPGSVGFSDDTGYPPEPDVDAAADLIAEYEAEEGALDPLVLQIGTGVPSLEEGNYLLQVLDEIGVTVELEVVQEDVRIDDAISGDFQMQIDRRFAVTDPDEVTPWLLGESPLNFSRLADVDLDALLAEARSEPDPDARAELYQEVDRLLAEQVPMLWLTHPTWAVGAVPDVAGFDAATAPEMPNGDEASSSLAQGHAVHGLWIVD